MGIRRLRRSAPAPVVAGSARWCWAIRLTLANSQVSHDVRVLDAFSSDAIPIHLLTTEALRSQVVMARRPERVQRIAADTRWTPLADARPASTDDFSNIWTELR